MWGDPPSNKSWRWVSNVIWCLFQASGDRVAVKMFTGGPQFKSIKREIDVVQQLAKHENIVSLFGVEEDVSKCYALLSFVIIAFGYTYYNNTVICYTSAHNSWE